MIVWRPLEAVERQQFVLFPSDVAEHVDRHAPVVCKCPELNAESHRASFQRCIAAGVKIAAGTDAGGGDPMRHGNIVRELEVMVETGLQPMQAIEAATRVAAELVGTIDDVGTIEVGKQADFILVDGDPLSDVRDLRNLWAVYQGGRRIR